MGRQDDTASQSDALGYEARRLRRNPALAWTDEAGRSRVTPVEGRMVIGAAAEVDLVVADPAVSRLHAELDPREQGLAIRDLGSRNGTYVEGVRIESAWLPDGGRLRVGNTEMTVTYAKAETQIDLWPSARFGPLVGGSVPMRELFARLSKIAGSEATVLIQGETGTGKELVARALHDSSLRAGGPFVIVDCAALPEQLLEAELFGHARGAFTGAVDARAGAIEGADGGTVFLDEIGELPLAMQPKLLRVLESRTVRRLGETRQRSVNVRFVSATHRDLRTMVNGRGFREDLYFRLAVVPVTVPPLRDRPSDILPLVQHFLPPGASGVNPELVRELVGRPWYGNVRELRSFVERALALGPEEALALTESAPAAPAASASLSLPDHLQALAFKEMRLRALDEIERAYLAALLARHGRNVSAVADAAGLERTYLHRLLRKHRL